MSVHLRNWLVTVVGICVAAAPAVFADPAVKSLLTNHPAAAGYLVGTAGLLTAVYRALSKTPPGAGGST